MDRSVEEDDTETTFHLPSSSSSPALAYLGTHTDHTPPTNSKQQSQGFDFSAQDVLAGYNFHASSQPRRRTFSVENLSSRRHRSSGSPVYLTGEVVAVRKDAEMDSHSSKIASAVDCTIKKYADNILRVLEGMNGRLSHLESVSQVLKNSVASLKASVDSYHNEADARLKALNNHVMEMHRAVQILRDKQDIVEANAELAKLQASKAKEVCEKATKQPVVSSQIATQEQLTAVSNLMPKRFPTELQASSQQLNEISGQLQQLSVSADVKALSQPTQGHTLQPIQQSHVLSPSELCPTLQPQEKIQSMPGMFQAQSQHMQSQQFVQLQLGSFQAQPQQVQAQQSFQSQQGVFEAQQQHVQTQQSLQSQQGTFQAQRQHMQTQQSVHLQQELFQAQQQQVHIRESAQSQEGALQAQQQHVLTEQTLPFQQGAFQTQAHNVQPQQGIQAPQGIFQAQAQHVQIQQSAQSQRGGFQSQQQHKQIQQNVQSQQGVIQPQSQQAQTQQIFQPHQGLQAQPFQAFVQQSPQPPSQMAITTSYSEKAQFQVVPQQSNILQPAVGQPSSVHVPSSAQFGSGMQTLPAQQLSQVQPASNFQSKIPKNNLSTQSMGGQMLVQPPPTQQTPNVHIPSQGVPPGPGSFQFTQQNESFSHAPLSQGTVKHSPYSAGTPYNVSNTGSSQQHPFSSQPILPAQHINLYNRIPSPLQGPQPVFTSQMARPAISSATSAGALPVAQNVYNQPLSGGALNRLLWEDGIVEKVAAMGYSSDEVRSAIKRLKDQGQIVDMNMVLGSMVNARNQSISGWQAR